MAQQEWLPIGSVVKVRNFNKPVMIYGRKQRQEASGKVFDYVAVPYPEGNISEDFNMFFNISMIAEVYFKGFETEEELNLRNSLSEEENH
ncbi:DUF4176 domain-containing protein [Alkalihalophilus pseudofirmus]|nr:MULTISPECIES: DUF4176 domain-containing protein [Alkalihalophilus]MDV2887179.1 DUF4176 domain-containing protein [Alkalihalophilus pseudofirmus]MED1602070.1 DUF4176 domain-containing protein [Alkalihalophilus marmarensis]